MALSYAEIGLDTAFSLFIVIHVAILMAVIWNVFKVLEDEKTRLDGGAQLRPICIGGTSSSGFDFSSISSVHDTNSRLVSSNVKCHTVCF